MNSSEFLRIVDFLQQLESTTPERKKEYTTEETTNPNLCAKCGGECCKGCGCHFSPEDFEDTSFEGLKRELEKGYISIDRVDGRAFDRPEMFFILRIRNRGARIVYLNYERGEPCILLTEKGCKLSYTKRPTGGRLLIPVAVKYKGLTCLNCQSAYTIEDCCMEWRPYQQVLSELIHYFKYKDYPCLL